jgi:hypothetical protein
MGPQHVIALSSKRRIATQLQRPPFPIQSRYDLNELECSDYGRDPRFLPGWWIVPMCFIALLGVWVFLYA